MVRLPPAGLVPAVFHSRCADRRAVVPWFIFTTRRLRHIACAALVVLQLLIALTGNYAFFNLLTVALALTLLDDASWPGWAGGPRDSMRGKLHAGRGLSASASRDRGGHHGAGVARGAGLTGAD